jgi:hypothetical protein
MDPSMDAAHRGITALAESGQELVQGGDVAAVSGQIGTDAATTGDQEGAEDRSVATQVAAMPDADDLPDAQQLFGAATQGSSEEIPYRADMEAAYQTDFSAVQAHTGAAEPLAAMGAEAAASGQSVAFASKSPSRAVVAHELAHVVQSRQSGSTLVMASSVLSQPSDAAEIEADGAATAVVTGDLAPAVIQRPSAQINRSFISFVLKMGAKKASKGMLKNFVKTQIKSRIKKLTDKKLVKELLQEADDVLGMLDDPWWVTTIGFVPIIGDAFDLVHVPTQIRKAVQRADELEDKVKKALKAQHVVKLGQQIVEQASRLGFKTRIAANRAPFNSHGQTVFSDGKNYITRDIDQHRGGVWKMFDRKGRRLGTYDADLNRIAD